MSCCASCKVGNPCETSCDEHGPKAFRQFKDRLAGLTVGDGEIKQLDAKIRNLNTDIMASDMTAAEKLDWTAFVTSWLQWFQDHDTMLSQTGGNVGAEFDAFLATYNERLRQFKARGGQTQASPATPDAPITGGLGGAASATTSILFGVAIAAGIYLIASGMKK